MAIEFFDTNKGIVNELKGINHSSKEGKKLLRKVFIEMGGMPILFSHLKESPDGNRIRKKYYTNLILIVIVFVLMFALIFAAFALTGGKDIPEFNFSESIVFGIFVFTELAVFATVLLLAFRSWKILYEGLSYSIYTYPSYSTDTAERSIATYPFKRAKANKKILIITFIVTFIVMFSLQFFGNDLIHKMLSGQEKTFTKAGMTITLTSDFDEEDNISQTATYVSNQYIVVILKEDFSTLSQLNISSDFSLNEYAKNIISGNSVDSKVQEKDGVVYFIYNKKLSGKDFSYFEVVLKGSDAFWDVTFACETKDLESSQAQFLNWAKTVELP